MKQSYSGLHQAALFDNSRGNRRQPSFILFALSDQLRAEEDRPGSQRGLYGGFKCLAAVQRSARGVSALWIDEALRPAQPVQRLPTLLSAAVLFQKGLTTQVLLELDRLLGHAGFPF